MERSTKILTKLPPCTAQNI